MNESKTKTHLELLNLSSCLGYRRSRRKIQTMVACIRKHCLFGETLKNRITAYLTFVHCWTKRSSKELHMARSSDLLYVFTCQQSPFVERYFTGHRAALFCICTYAVSTLEPVYTQKSSYKYGQSIATLTCYSFELGRLL